jgi:tetratricopeptide (TPR) repeat protein
MIKAEKNNDFLNQVKAKIYIAFLDQDLAAIEEYAKLILSLEPDNAFTIQSLTGAYFGTGNYEAAIETGKLIIPLKNAQEQKQRVLNQIAMASNFIGKPDSAMVYVQQAIALDTTVGYPYSTLAETYHYLGDRARFLYFLELSFKKGLATSVIQQTDQPYQNFWEDPDFQALLKTYSETSLKD